MKVLRWFAAPACAAVLALSACANVQQGTYQEAREAYSKGRYDQAYTIMKGLAEKGEVNA